MSLDPLVHDWNEGNASGWGARRVELLDETLRDGLQSPSARNPKLEQKLEGLRRMARLGVAAVNLGLPSVSAAARDEVVQMLRLIREERLDLLPVCAGRTLPSDVTPILELAEAAGIAVEVSVFVGASPIRWRAEGWDLQRVSKLTRDAVSLGARAGLPVTFVTEDTTRSPPDTLRALFELALRHGAKRLCLCDTVGAASAEGVRRLVAFAREVAGPGASLDWHGHDDRGLGLANALTAIEAGVDRVHATALGVGERVGNTPLELLVVNLALLAGREPDAARLRAYVEHFASALGVAIPEDHPLLGANAFRTATGVHAAAIVKALDQGEALADRVYSLLPVSHFSSGHDIRIGYMSGTSNVVHWLRRHSIEPSEALVSRILERARAANRVLRDDEVLAVVRAR
ncbi:MAG TPA: 2-isopropylmalate synthase [Polyangiaceae bacterium]|nr:2-isopropylmalate synthase [Polyangiaceae bacterium]